MNFVILLLLFVNSISSVPIAPEIDFWSDTIIEHINSLNTTWKAGKNFDGLSTSMIKRLFMSSEAKVSPIEEKDLRYPKYSVADLLTYTNFDSRSKWASGNGIINCPSIGQIFDQGSCAPSWIYASVGQIADRLCIMRGIKIDVQGTVKRMITHSYDCKFNSADMVKAFQYWQENGFYVAEEKKCLPFSEHCEYVVKDKSLYKVYYYQPTNQQGIQRNILEFGPMSMLIDIYSDLLHYKSGVYQRTSNTKLGSHVVKAIGWGVESGVDYWLIANSWGTKWGEDGFFKLKRSTENPEIKQMLTAESNIVFNVNTDFYMMENQQTFLKPPK